MEFDYWFNKDVYVERFEIVRDSEGSSEYRYDMVVTADTRSDAFWKASQVADGEEISARAYDNGDGTWRVTITAIRYW